MFVVSDVAVATMLCIITMLGWGSWANTQKLAGKDKWAFPLFYWDYAVGVLFLGIVLALTMGSFGQAGMPALENLKQADAASIGRAFFSGVLFNFSNILLVVAIDAAGMSVAFPVGVGLALVIGTVVSYLQMPRGSAALLFSGVALVLVAMVLSAMAHRKLPQRAGHRWARGILFAVLAGCLMGFFYPQLAAAVSPDFNTAPIAAGRLTPYAALIIFGLGLLISNIFLNTVFMRSEKLEYRDYWKGSVRLHSLGFLGGVIWMLALTMNVIASGVVGPAVSYALGQGATLVAAIWGVVIWREFRLAPSGTGRLLALMFLAFGGGLVLIGTATL